MFPDLTKHPDYLRGQTMDWCNQLAAKTGKYEYSWRSICEGQSAEDILTEQLSSMLHGRVLDVGCAHGEYTSQWADHATEVIGYDMTEGFIATANRNRKSNVRYVTGRTREGLPFEDDYFDLVYTKKGPTSWYKEGNRIVRPGGKLLMLHPGDGDGEGGELGLVFPGLFGPPSAGTPILDRIQERLETSGLTDIHIAVLKETTWIPAPEDVLKMICFGQSDAFTQYAREQCYDQIVSQFDTFASEQGIKTTGFYYFIQATAAGKLEPDKEGHF